ERGVVRSLRFGLALLDVQPAAVAADLPGGRIACQPALHAGRARDRACAVRTRDPGRLSRGVRRTRADAYACRAEGRADRARCGRAAHRGALACAIRSRPRQLPGAARCAAHAVRRAPVADRHAARRAGEPRDAVSRAGRRVVRDDAVGLAAGTSNATLRSALRVRAAVAPGGRMLMPDPNAAPRAQEIEDIYRALIKGLGHERVNDENVF